MNTGVLIILAAFFCQTVDPPAAESVTILSIDFDGNKGLDSSRLRSRMRQARQGARYHPEILKLELQDLERFCREEGFLRAAVDRPSLEFSEVAGRGKMVAVRVPIAEGPRYALGKLEVRNVHALSVDTLLQMSPLQRGMPYSRGRLSAWIGKVTEAYYSLGHLRVQATLREAVDDARHVVDCTLDCIEGDVYRVRAIRVVGLDSGEATQDFLRRLLVGTDMPYNPEMLAVSLHLLNQMGRYQPMTEEQVRVTIDEVTRSVDLEFHPVMLRKLGTSLRD